MEIQEGKLYIDRKGTKRVAITKNSERFFMSVPGKPLSSGNFSTCLKNGKNAYGSSDFDIIEEFKEVMKLDIEVGKSYANYNGKKVDILYELKTPKAFYNFVGVVDGEFVAHYSSYGQSNVSHNLKEEWVDKIEFAGFMNIYPDSLTDKNYLPTIFTNKQSANLAAYGNRLRCVEVICKEV